jgi:HK97 family phage major capsid protein
MGKRRTSADIAAEMEVLRAELVVLDEKDDATDEDVARSTSLFDDWSKLNDEKTAAEAYEAKIEAVRSAALNPTRVEAGDGVSRMAGSTGPELKRNLDPYADQETIVRGTIPDEDLIARAKTAIEQAPEWMDQKGREHVTRLIELESRQSPLIARHMLMTGSPEYHAQFKEFIRTQYPGQLLRTAMSLTDANGGVLVPFTLDPTIILTNAGIVDPIRGIATVKQIATNDWNGVTSAGVSAEWLGEGSEAADKSPTFTQPTITPRKGAAWVFGSYEVLADSGFASELATLLADAKARLEGAAFATGNTGASVPRGVVAAVAAVTASIVSSATITAFALGDVYRVANALRARDASQASWLANKTIFNLIRQFDTAGGGGFWTNLPMGTPNELLGQPAYECSTMGSVITTSANILLAGDMKKYFIIDRIGMSVLYEPMVKGSSQRPTGQAGWFAFFRTGADVVDADAFRLLQLNTTPGFTALG